MVGKSALEVFLEIEIGVSRSLFTAHRALFAPSRARDSSSFDYFPQPFDAAIDPIVFDLKDI